MIVLRGIVLVTLIMLCACTDQHYPKWQENMASAGCGLSGADESCGSAQASASIYSTVTH